MLLNMNILKDVFLDVINEKKTFEEASAWAYERMQADEMGKLELDPSEDTSKIFSGLTSLLGVDLQVSPGIYLYSISDVKSRFDELFSEQELEKLAIKFILEREKDDLSKPILEIKDKAEDLGEDWLMCPLCQEAWQSQSKYGMVLCPKCNNKLHNPKFPS